MELKKGWRIYDRDEKEWYRVKKIKGHTIFGKMYWTVNERTHRLRAISLDRLIRELSTGGFVVLAKQFVCPLD